MDSEYILSNQELDFFNKNGFLIIKNYISNDNINFYREKIDGNYDKNFLFPKIDLDLVKLYHNKKIKSIMKQIFEVENIYSSFLLKIFNSKYNDTQESFSRMHTDTYRNKKEINLDKNLKIVKTLIYLQDLDKYSGTLKVRPKSHLCSSFPEEKNKLKTENLCIEKKLIIEDFNFPIIFDKCLHNCNINSGDLVIFDIRLHHTGHSLRLKKFPNLALDDKYDNLLKNSNLIIPKNNVNRILIQNEFLGNEKYFETFKERFYKNNNKIKNLLKNNNLNKEDLDKVLEDSEILTFKDIYDLLKINE